MTGLSRTLYHPQDGPPSPVPHLFQTLTDFCIAPRPARLLLGFRSPTFLTTTGTGHLSSPSTIQLRQFAPFEGPLFGILQQAAGVSLHSGTPLRTLGFPKGQGGVYLYLPLHASRRYCLYTPV